MANWYNGDKHIKRREISGVYVWWDYRNSVGNQTHVPYSTVKMISKKQYIALVNSSAVYLYGNIRYSLSEQTVVQLVWINKSLY